MFLILQIVEVNENLQNSVSNLFLKKSIKQELH